MVGDKRWSWEGFLPYFCKTERHYDPKVSSKIHGHVGSVYTASVSSSGRNYPLREPIKAAWASLGIQKVEDINDGSPLGVAEVVESRTKGQRVISSAAYSLNGVTILSSTMAQRILVSSLKDGTKVATGVELANGQSYSAKREVILSAGSIRTPQLLMLSGIGPAEELKRHNIPHLVSSPEVGKNLWDHLGIFQQWKLRHPELGAAVGSPAFTDPAFLTGNPIDWHTTSSVPLDGLKSAFSKDLHGSLLENHPLLTKGPRCHLGLIVRYASAPGFPSDGTIITSYALNYLPTSRGTITLASSDVNEKPIIDHNHLATEVDRYRIRFGARMFARLMSTAEGKEMVVGEAVPVGFKGIDEESTDEEIDGRARASSA
jgi:choline dehydrogenase-like flavoprotein